METNLPHAENTEETTEQYIHYDPQPDTEDQRNTPPDPEPPSTESQVVFIEIGKTLQEQRLSLHLSVEEIEQYTNIRAHYLKALEKGQLESLPSPVQGRGMLSNYAKFLNLNNEEMLLRFANGLTDSVERNNYLLSSAKPKPNKINPLPPRLQFFQKNICLWTLS